VTIQLAESAVADALALAAEYRPDGGRQAAGQHALPSRAAHPAGRLGGPETGPYWVTANFEQFGPA
jgi:hypothetical protein